MATYLVTTYSISIKTAPHQQWFFPAGWGPYQTEPEAQVALRKASDLWMDARIVKHTERREMAPHEADALRRMGATIAAIGSEVRP